MRASSYRFFKVVGMSGCIQDGQQKQIIHVTILSQITVIGAKESSESLFFGDRLLFAAGGLDMDLPCDSTPRDSTQYGWTVLQMRAERCSDSKIRGFEEAPFLPNDVATASLP
jgi:hypothetical protein